MSGHDRRHSLKSGHGSDDDIFEIKSFGRRESKHSTGLAEEGAGSRSGVYEGSGSDSGPPSPSPSPDDEEAEEVSPEQADADKDATEKPSKSAAVFNAMKGALMTVMNYMRRYFGFPLVKEPISFCRPEDFTTSGQFDPNRKPNREESDALEILCNYDKNTKEIFEHILKERKEALESKDKYQSQTLDVSKYPPWDDAVIERLRSTFQVFDVNMSGLIEFEELCEVLNEFGDKTPAEERRKHFDAADVNHDGGIDFEEFMKMYYALTVKTVAESALTLAETFKRIDRNMTRIRSLDVVQQLQAGLF